MKKASRCCGGRVDTVGVKLAEGKGPGQKHRDTKTVFAGGVGPGKNHRDAKTADSKELWKSVEKAKASRFARRRTLASRSSNAGELVSTRQGRGEVGRGQRGWR